MAYVNEAHLHIYLNNRNIIEIFIEIKYFKVCNFCRVVYVLVMME